MAPLIGVSLYTWTSIIGVVLAGISLGNYIGGKLADRFASRRTLGILFLVSGLASLSILFTASALAAYKGPTTFPLMARIVLLTAGIFFLPSCLLGTISPLLVKLTLRDLIALRRCGRQDLCHLDRGQHPGHLCHGLLPGIAVRHPHDHSGRQPAALPAGDPVRRLAAARALRPLGDPRCLLVAIVVRCGAADQPAASSPTTACARPTIIASR